MAGQVCERLREKQDKAAGHSRPSSPRQKDKKVSRDSIIGLYSPGQWVEGCHFPWAEGGSP